MHTNRVTKAYMINLSCRSYLQPLLQQPSVFGTAINKGMNYELG